MKIQCPSCDQRLEIPEELAGQTIECPACNASLAVPSLATPPPSPVQVQQSAPQVTASEKPKSSIPKWAIASVAGIAVLVVCLIMFFPNDPNGVSLSGPIAVKTNGESQQSTTSQETLLIQRVEGAKAPDISIHEAGSEGNIEAVKQHLAAGTDVNAKDESNRNRTVLHYVANEGQKEAAKLLIANGADVNAKDDDDRTPLLEAYRHKDIVQLLIKEGADMNARNNKGETIRDLVTIWFDEPETLNLLRKYGAKNGFWFRAEESIYIAVCGGHLEAVKKHLLNGADVNEKNEFSRTPLHGAVLESDNEIVEFLITKGANVNVFDRWKKTPLDYATDSNSQDQDADEEVVDLLRKHGAKTAEELKAAGN